MRDPSTILDFGIHRGKVLSDPNGLVKINLDNLPIKE